MLCLSMYVTVMSDKHRKTTYIEQVQKRVESFFVESFLWTPVHVLSNTLKNTS